MPSKEFFLWMAFFWRCVMSDDFLSNKNSDSNDKKATLPIVNESQTLKEWLSITRSIFGVLGISFLGIVGWLYLRIKKNCDLKKNIVRYKKNLKKEFSRVKYEIIDEKGNHSLVRH
jgi:hypothetical protein